jgi:AAA domain
VPQFFCSLPNTKKAGRIPCLITDDPEAIAAFIKRWDKPGRGVYQCINPLRPGATRRSIEDVGIIVRIPADIDYRDLITAPDEIEQRLRSLPLLPTWVRRSGGGLHIGWELKEPIEPTDAGYFTRACKLHKALVACLSGDLAVTHPAALLRVEGSHNTKHGAPVLVETVWGSGKPVDFSELEALVDALPADGMFTRKPAGNGRARQASEFVARATTVDVELELTGIHHGNIHYTWKNCMGSLLRKGMRADEVVERLLAACETSPACQSDPGRKHWRKGLAEMLTWYIRSDREFILNLSPPLQERWHATTRRGGQATLIWRRYLGLHVKGHSNHQEAKETKPETEPKAAEAKGQHEDSPSTKRYRFPLISFNDMRPGPEPNYLVDELIPAAGLALIYGAPKSGKSFWTLDVFLHVALGWEYRDRSVQQGAVIYCAFEGAFGYRKRCEAFRRHHCLTDGIPPLFIVPGRADLIKDHAGLIRDLQGQLADMGVTQRVQAVILDTLNKSLIGSESKDVDMANYIAAAEAIQKAFGCIVTIVHHHGIEESRPRGHTSLRGAVDAQIKITRDEHNNIIAEIEDMRDGPEGIQVASRLVVVDVGEDTTGKRITSAAIEPIDKLEGPARPRHRLTPNQATMLALLEEAGPQGLTVSEWNDRAKAAGLGGHRRATLVDLRTELRRKGLAVAKGEIWLAVSRQRGDLDL